ncbi:MAG TPA: pilin [Gammaproteobacteria bacterium]|nr:pilin [Gammaproteobacteria bacterium]
MNKAQKGFTLIELMIVIAIIGILAAIAIPQYQDYVTRSKLTEGLNLAAAAKTAVAETYQTMGYMPASTNVGGLNSWGLPTDVSIAGKYVSAIAVSAGAGPGNAAGGEQIVITYNPATVGGSMTGATDTLTLTPYTSAGGVSWACGYGTTEVSGSALKGPGPGTTVIAKYLPSNCR